MQEHLLTVESGDPADPDGRREIVTAAPRELENVEVDSDSGLLLALDGGTGLSAMRVAVAVTVAWRPRVRRGDRRDFSARWSPPWGLLVDRSA
jgi:hypothetical protein